MAKQKNGVNKSQKVRDVLAKNPQLSVREIVDTLAKDGVKVQPSLVYVVRDKAKIKRRRAAREKAAQAVTNGDPITTVRKVKALAVEVGGIRKLRELIDILAE